MVHLHTVAQRTTKGASRRSITFSYEVKLTSNETDEQNTISLDVCKNAFMQLLGITAQNLRTVQCSLKHNGMPPVDKRGKNPKKWKLSEKTVELVMKHISSYKGQLSHYSLKTSKRIYLPAALNKSKLYRDFNERYPLVKISQTSYTTILDSKFNISFARIEKTPVRRVTPLKRKKWPLRRNNVPLSLNRKNSTPDAQIPSNTSRFILSKKARSPSKIDN